jgi:tetratricopeptide (TPR) repeat protein
LAIRRSSQFAGGALRSRVFAAQIGAKRAFPSLARDTWTRKPRCDTAGRKALRRFFAVKPEKMTRFSTVLCLLACSALPAPANAQAAAPGDDARTCATQTGPAAIDGCTRAIASRRFAHGEVALLHYRRAVLLREANELDRAIADVTTTIELNGNAIPMAADAFDLRITQRNAYALRARTFADKRDYARALADYAVLLAADPRDVSALLARAGVLAQQGACERALADYDAAIGFDAKGPDGYLGRARCHARLGARGRAIADYRAALAAGVPDAIRGEVAAELEKLGAAP